MLELKIEMKKKKSLLVEGEILVFRFVVTLVLMVGVVYVMSKIDANKLTNSVFLGDALGMFD